MRKRLLTFALLVLASPAVASEFDAHVKACHDEIWSRDEFKDVPNAGIYAYPGGFDDTTFYAYWIVDWEGLQAAGKCNMEKSAPKVTDIVRFAKK